MNFTNSSRVGKIEFVSLDGGRTGEHSGVGVVKTTKVLLKETIFL